MKHLRALGAAMAIAASTSAAASPAVVAIRLIDENGVGQEIGTIAIDRHGDGVVFQPDLSNLPPGPHGFHLHQNPSCSPAAKDGKMTAGLAAGGHFDPAHAQKHLGPEHAGKSGHLGDLPALVVAADGKATEAVAAPHLTLEDLKGRALVIHEGGDNYADEPKPLGGGGARIACGIVE